MLTLLINPRDYHPMLDELYHVQQDANCPRGTQYTVDLEAIQAELMVKAKAPIDAVLAKGQTVQNGPSQEKA